jgi:hypothetical protein
MLHHFPYLARCRLYEAYRTARRDSLMNATLATAAGAAAAAGAAGTGGPAAGRAAAAAAAEAAEEREREEEDKAILAAVEKVADCFWGPVFGGKPGGSSFEPEDEGSLLWAASRLASVSQADWSGGSAKSGWQLGATIRDALDEAARVLQPDGGDGWEGAASGSSGGSA